MIEGRVQPRGDDVLAALAEWVRNGWLRRLDAALARFVAAHAPEADGVVLVATALVAHLEGQGHTCLVIVAMLADPAATLRWDGPALAALDSLLARLPREPAAWIAALSRCGAVAVDTGPDGGGEPLVLSGERLYLRRYWQAERRIAAQVRSRLARRDEVDERAVRTWLDRLFPDGADASGPDWQKVACAIALRSRLTIVTGGPGTGKTFTAARFLALAHATSQPSRIALAAPTGKAAARLQQSIDEALDDLRPRIDDESSLAELRKRIGPARTLHGLLGTRPGSRRFRHDAANPLDVDVVVVDEASMVHVEMMDALLAALPPHARLLLLGDKDQLASVEAGAVLGELCRDADHARYDAETVRFVDATCGVRLPDDCIDASGPRLAQHTVMLRRSRRFSTAIAALARAVNAGDADTATMRASQADGPVAWQLSPTPGAVVELASRGRPDVAGGYRPYLDAMHRRLASPSEADRSAWIRDVLAAFESFRVLCAVRDGEWGVSGLNRAIAERLTHDGLLAATTEWYEGRPVMVTRNDPGLGVFNGDIGIVLRLGPDDTGLRACFADGPTVRTIGVGRLGHVETAFAMTVHKSQGSEFDHTVLVLPPEANPVTTRELAYTGITRARTAFTLVSSGREALRDAIARTTRRSSGLLGFIDEG